MKLTSLGAVLAPLCIATSVQAASISYTGFDASHFHAGGNVGGGYTATTTADRTDPILLSPSGVVQGSEANAYTGNIGTVVGTRVGRAETESDTIGLMQSDGFFFRSEVTTQSECIETNITGCLPFMRNQATLTFDFTVDTNSTMYFDGSWVGGNEDPASISIVDFLGLSVSRVTIAGGTIPVFGGVNTNGGQNGQDFGAVSGFANLNAGTTYRFGFNQSAFAQSVSATGAIDNDASYLAFSASFFEDDDVAAFQSRYDALTIAPVPVPAGGLMLIAGIGMMGAMVRSRRA